MSRIGKLPIKFNPETSVKVTSDKVVVSGKNGELSLTIPKGVEVKIEDNQILVDSQASNMHGLVRSLLNNMVLGVTVGWTKTLELSGTGYRANTTGTELNLSLGFSHPVVIKAPDSIKFEVSENKIKVVGTDKMLVGQVASQIRDLRPADPYKAKGFKYEGEVIIKKPGKAAKAGATAAK
jgi:large subunit ribosomal protein L6